MSTEQKAPFVLISPETKRDRQCAAAKVLLTRANKNYCTFYKISVEDGQLCFDLNDGKYNGISLSSIMRYMKIFLPNNNDDHVQVLTNCVHCSRYKAYSSLHSNYINIVCFDMTDNILLYICVPHKKTSDWKSNRKESTYQTCDHITVAQEFGGIFCLITSDGFRDRQEVAYYDKISQLESEKYKFYEISTKKDDEKTYVYISDDYKYAKIYILDMVPFIKRYLLCTCGQDNKRPRDNIRALIDSINHDKYKVYNDGSGTVIIAFDDDNDILVTFKIDIHDQK